VRQVLDLQKGSVIELDRMAGDAVDVYVNDRLIAQGEVVVVDDNFGVRISRLISPNHEEGAA
jgi:flagellar motor switch protein FliN/FliY